MVVDDRAARHSAAVRPVVAPLPVPEPADPVVLESVDSGDPGVPEGLARALDAAAIIREVHVYGPVAPLQTRSAGQAGDAQHVGVGARLIAAAEDQARAAGYARLAVISAIGTRDYYIRHGFEPDNLYLTKTLSPRPL